jgi:hypothetical protein
VKTVAVAAVRKRTERKELQKRMMGKYVESKLYEMSTSHWR